MELASIVVPVYNIEKYIENCIESLICQTYENLEILLIDDGSTDASGKICDEYSKKDSRIRVLHKTNGGLSDARNKGAQLAAGKYLFFVDGDDTVSEKLVENAVRCQEKEKADMVFFDFESVEEETGRRDLYSFQLPQGQKLRVEECPELLLKTPAAWCRMYTKEFWDRAGIRYPEGIHYEDLATTPRLICRAKSIVYAGGEPLYYYMLRKGSIMRSSNFTRSFQDRTHVLDYLENYFQENGKDKKYKKQLEYLFFEHGYFFPLKEIILEDTESPWIGKFKDYALGHYPDMLKNPYLKDLSKKDKILLFLMKHGQYKTMNLLSGARKKKDSIKNR